MHLRLKYWTIINFKYEKAKKRSPWGNPEIGLSG